MACNSCSTGKDGQPKGCKNNGTCSEITKDFFCKCLPEDCHNKKCPNEENDFHCKCQPGFRGRLCEQKGTPNQCCPIHLCFWYWTTLVVKALTDGLFNACLSHKKSTKMAQK